MGIQHLCNEFGKHRQSWYEAIWRADDQLLVDALIVEQVIKIRNKLPRVGTRKLHFLMKSFFQQHHIKLGIQGLNEVLRRHDLLINRRKKRAVTTYSRHFYKKYTNLIEDLIPLRPDHIWVSDLTYIIVPSISFSYLSLLTDAYSRKILGWSLQETLKADGPLEALRMAISGRKYIDQELIHHSDRGIQYCCNAYIDLLWKHKIQSSMTKNGDPYENALAERMNGILKSEFLLHGFLSHEKALKKIGESIENYNQFRPHGSIDYLTPAQAHQMEGPIKKRWGRKNEVSIDLESNEA